MPHLRQLEGEEQDPQTAEEHQLISSFTCSTYSHRDISRFNDQQQLKIIGYLLQKSIINQANDNSIAKLCPQL